MYQELLENLLTNKKAAARNNKQTEKNSLYNQSNYRRSSNIP